MGSFGSVEGTTGSITVPHQVADLSTQPPDRKR
jgi:hypothetical protein